MKHIFLAHFAKNKKNGTVANFWPRPWTIPFQKIPIFRLLLTCCFYSLERRFFFHSRISWNTLCCPILSKIKIKKMEKLPVLDQNHWLTFWKKAIFLTFFASWFYCLWRRFLRNGKRAACNHGVMDASGRLLSTKKG